MVSNVGKNFIFLISFFSFSCAAVDLKLRVVDQNNIPLREATAGYPCKVELMIQGTSGSVPTMTIPGTEQFQIFGREMQTRSVNGASSVTQRYTLRIDKPGTYNLGPVELEIDGTHYTSNAYSLRVVDGPAPAPRHAERVVREEETDIFARLSLDKSRIVVGEKVTASLRVYVYGAEANIHALIKPDCDACTMGGYKEAVSGKEIIKNKQYSFLEWTWDVCPTRAGKVTIPAYGVEYDLPKNQIQRTTHHSFLSTLFNTIERKRMYSNASTLHVSELPSTDRTVQAVGEFTVFTAQVKPGIVEQGEGALITFELVGDAALDGIALFDLESMPSSLKWYASKVYTCEAKTEQEKSKRCFEYVVQGVESGEWTIPAQSFFYFDTKKRAYTTLSTAPISLRVKPSTMKKKKDDAAAADAQDGHMVIDDESSLAPLMTSDDDASGMCIALPWWLFFVSMLISVVICMRSALSNLYARVRGFDQPEYQRKRAYMSARASLLAAKKAHDMSRIYHVFMHLFATRAGVAVSHMTDNKIHAMIQESGIFSPSEVDAWDLFFNHAAQEAYMTSSAAHDMILFEQAEHWIVRLESGV